MGREDEQSQRPCLVSGCRSGMKGGRSAHPDRPGCPVPIQSHPDADPWAASDSGWPARGKRLRYCGAWTASK